MTHGATWRTIVGAGLILAGAGLVLSAARAEGPQPPGPVPAVKPVGPGSVREDVFEFTAAPAVKKEGDRYVITFAAKAACDATVAIVDADGRVVRHLASGVLGKNAPAPFQADALAQKLAWDGKTDGGQAAPAGCKVRVGLGLRAAFERNIFFDPAGFNSKLPAANVAVGPGGTLYAFQSQQVRAFDRQGRYVRTVIPWPAGIPADRIKGPHSLGTLKTVYGDSVPEGGWGGVLDALDGTPDAVAASPDGQRVIAILTEKRGGQRLACFASDGAFSDGPVALCRPTGLSSVAFSPDSKTAYFGGAKGILKKEVASLAPTPKGGLTLDAFIDAGPVAALAVDGDGNLFAAAADGSGIAVFSPAGKALKTLPLPGELKRPARLPRGADQADLDGSLAVHPKTGAIYRLAVSYGKDAPARLVKLGSLADPSVKASITIAPPPGADDRNVWQSSSLPAYRMALDAEADPPALWVSRGGDLLRLEDRGGAFEQVGRVAPAKSAVDADGFSMPRLFLDRRRDELYASWGDRVFGAAWYRFDARTGSVDPTMPAFRAIELAVGPDDLFYARVGRVGRYVVRFDRQLKVVDFPKGEKVKLDRVTAAIARQNPACLDTGSGHTNVWTEDMTVAPNGDLWVIAHWADEAWRESHAPWRTASQLSASGIVQVYAPDGALKCIDAIAQGKGSEFATTGLRVDRAGNACVGLPSPVDPAYGERRWPGLAKGQAPGDFRAWGKGPGSVVKFAARADGGWPIGRVSRTGPHDGMLWAFDGLSGVTGHSCGCAQKRWDMDDFARCFLPFNQLYSVMVVDANGNTVARLGRWGNVDSDGKGELGLVQIGAIAVGDSALYVADRGNRRIVKAALSYAAEQTVPLP